MGQILAIACLFFLLIPFVAYLETNLRIFLGIFGLEFVLSEHKNKSESESDSELELEEELEELELEELELELESVDVLLFLRLLELVLIDTSPDLLLSFRICSDDHCRLKSSSVLSATDIYGLLHIESPLTHLPLYYRSQPPLRVSFLSRHEPA